MSESKREESGKYDAKVEVGPSARAGRHDTYGLTATVCLTDALENGRLRGRKQGDRPDGRTKDRSASAWRLAQCSGHV
jgi:hypothetical protein